MIKFTKITNHTKPAKKPYLIINFRKYHFFDIYEDVNTPFTAKKSKPVSLSVLYYRYVDKL